MSRPKLEAQAPFPVAKPGKPGKSSRAPVSPAGPLMDDISLIRTKDGRVGWVLTNAIFLEVPDEVAQYAEGNRITAYFPMGEVTDGEKKHTHWLWATQSQKFAPFEFDGLRLFTYNLRRHRYETAHRERGLRGFFPILVDSSKPESEFKMVFDDATGKRWLKSYTFDGNRVRTLGKQPYVAPKDATPVSAGQPPPRPDPSLFDRMKKLLPGKR